MITKLINVRIADGSGAEPQSGTICFGTTILPADTPAERVIDGGGLLLAPGFIDAHGHSDLSALAAPECFGKVAQGFTTEISGNCGLSPFPLTEFNREHLAELYANYAVPLNWGNGTEYRAALNHSRVQLKLAPLCGHNTLRAAVAGYATHRLSATQQEAMCKLLDAELAAGAIGLSSGLLYTPGCFADATELTALLRVVARHDKIYTTHLRSEGKELLESLSETIAAARTAGLSKLHISHFKTAQPANWHKLDGALKIFEQAESDGISITFDRYPYLESLTQLSIIAEGRFASLDDSALTRALQEPDAVDELAGLLRRDWSTVRLASSTLEDFAPFAGQTFDRIADARQQPPAHIAAELLRRDACGCMAAFQGMSPDNLRRIATDPRCFCGTDESARPSDYRIGHSHPRGFGSLPRFWQLLAQAGLPTGEIVRRLSAAPANRFGLSDRGCIAPGLAADLVLLDESTLNSAASFATPHLPPVGIAHVWIDGFMVI